MKFELHYVELSDGQRRTLAAWDRAEIERRFRELAPAIASAEVKNEHGTVVARKEVDEPMLHGLPAAVGWGPVCHQCWSLAGCDRHAPPHSNLRVLSTQRYRGGMADGKIVNYGCAACGTELQLDNDRKDPGAGWGVHRWPTWVPDTWGVQL